MGQARAKEGKEMPSFSHTIEEALLVKQTVIKQTVKGKKKSKHLF